MCIRRSKISGFTFIRNGILLDYPFLESIQSLLRLCDEVVVVIGDSKDGTREAVETLADPKIKIIDTIWDENMRKGGSILACQTNIALDHITGDWGFYLQGDEIIHENEYDSIRQAIIQYQDDPNVEGLLFNYKHFYGTYNYIADGPSWYRREIRIVKNLPGIRSYRDAQGFRLHDRKIRVKLINATIYHYGWVKNPRAQQLKNESFPRYWHDDNWIKAHIVHAAEADYNLLESLVSYTGKHPAIMKERIESMYWSYDYDASKKKVIFKNWLKTTIFKLTGYMPGEYKNYKIV
jgi:glycosyltransferase involved in cell wall biosynthesis